VAWPPTTSEPPSKTPSHALATSQKATNSYRRYLAKALEQLTEHLWAIGIGDVTHRHDRDSH
jgi:hypothetical protein